MQRKVTTECYQKLYIVHCPSINVISIFQRPCMTLKVISVSYFIIAIMYSLQKTLKGSSFSHLIVLDVFLYISCAFPLNYFKHRFSLEKFIKK